MSEKRGGGRWASQKDQRAASASGAGRKRKRSFQADPVSLMLQSVMRSGQACVGLGHADGSKNMAGLI